jgi:hypothetical protein
MGFRDVLPGRQIDGAGSSLGRLRHRASERHWLLPGRSQPHPADDSLAGDAGLPLGHHPRRRDDDHMLLSGPRIAPTGVHDTWNARRHAR